MCVLLMACHVMPFKCLSSRNVYKISAETLLECVEMYTQKIYINYRSTNLHSFKSAPYSCYCELKIALKSKLEFPQNVCLSVCAMARS